MGNEFELVRMQPSAKVAAVVRRESVGRRRPAQAHARSPRAATMHYCAVVGCSSSKKQKHISFFRLPKEEETRKKWLQLIGRPDIASTPTTPNNHFVCSLHFEDSMLISVPKLKPDALPAKLLPSSSRLMSYEEKSTQTDELKIDISSALIYSADNKSSGPTTSDNVRAESSLAVPLSPAPRKRKPRGEPNAEQKRRKQQNGSVDLDKEAQGKN